MFGFCVQVRNMECLCLTSCFGFCFCFCFYNSQWGKGKWIVWHTSVHILKISALWKRRHLEDDFSQSGWDSNFWRDMKDHGYTEKGTSFHSIKGGVSRQPFITEKMPLPPGSSWIFPRNCGSWCHVDHSVGFPGPFTLALTPTDFLTCFLRDLEKRKELFTQKYVWSLNNILIFFFKNIVRVKL